jgi:hypothetical protein
MKNLDVLCFCASLFFVQMHSSTSFAYLVREAQPGILEIRGATTNSLIINKVHIGKNRKWIYIEVLEARPLSGTKGFLGFRPDKDRVRYFYAPLKTNKFKPNQNLSFVRYAMNRRIQNSHGRIPFGSQHVFYPLSTVN